MIYYIKVERKDAVKFNGAEIQLCYVMLSCTNLGNILEFYVSHTHLWFVFMSIIVVAKLSHVCVCFKGLFPVIDSSY